MNVITDALAAAGMLLAALTLVYSAWSASIDAGLNKTFSPGAAAKIREKDDIRAVRNYRAAPMAVACWLVAIIFARRDLHIISESLKYFGAKSWEYDDVSTIFLFTQVLVIGLALHVSRQILGLNDKLKL
jgi:hypothetical protein